MLGLPVVGTVTGAPNVPSGGAAAVRRRPLSVHAAIVSPRGVIAMRASRLAAGRSSRSPRGRRTLRPELPCSTRRSEPSGARIA